MIQKPQQVLTEAQVQSAVSWLNQVEQGVDELLEKRPAIDDNELEVLSKAVQRCKDYAWALRTFPVFDLAALRIQKVQKVRARFRGQVAGPPRGVYHFDLELEPELQLPAFASIEWSPNGGTYETYLTQLGNLDLHRAAVAKVLNVQPQQVTLETWSTRLQAICPKPPASVVKSVTHIKSRFDEISIGYDAEWSAAPVRDPLVIGRIANSHFLIDEYDASKLERYIASEFTRRPKT